MSDAKANIDSYIERLEKPAGVPPFIQREVAMIMRHQQAEIERLTTERDYWHNACAFAIEQRKPLEKVLEAMVNAVPTTWLDPTLSGDDAIPLPMGTREVEELMRRIKSRLQAIAALKEADDV